MQNDSIFLKKHVVPLCALLFLCVFQMVGLDGAYEPDGVASQPRSQSNIGLGERGHGR